MILLACTDYSAFIIEAQTLAEKLGKQDLETKIFKIHAANRYAEIIITKGLIAAIKKASLVLLFVQPYPCSDWEDPHDSFYNMIYSFVNSSPSAKRKTVLMTPFLQQEKETEQSNLITDILERAGLGHFEIFPKNPAEFLKPPFLRIGTISLADPLALADFHNRIVTFCNEKIKKS